MIAKAQPPSGGCVLKLRQGMYLRLFCNQPPSGGYVLKHLNAVLRNLLSVPAAFGRLCVETFMNEHL